MIHDILYLRTVFQEVSNSLSEFFKEFKAKKTDVFKELQKKGIVVIPNFFSKEKCEYLIQEFEVILSNEKIYKIIKDELNSDSRAFGADLASSAIFNYLNHEFIVDELSNYLGEPLGEGFTMANRVIPISGNLGSGGGWHRDSPHKKQVKFLLYLTDVEDENGPFEYIMGSHRPKDVLKNRIKYGYSFNQNRFSEKQIEDLINTKPENHKVVTGEAGTLVLTDTRGIHRGKPINMGNRYALTNYFYSRNIPSHVKRNLIL